MHPSGEEFVRLPATSGRPRCGPGASTRWSPLAAARLHARRRRAGSSRRTSSARRCRRCRPARGRLQASHSARSAPPKTVVSGWRCVSTLLMWLRLPGRCSRTVSAGLPSIVGASLYAAPSQGVEWWKRATVVVLPPWLVRACVVTIARPLRTSSTSMVRSPIDVPADVAERRRPQGGGRVDAGVAEELLGRREGERRDDAPVDALQRGPLLADVREEPVAVGALDSHRLRPVHVLLPASVGATVRRRGRTASDSRAWSSAGRGQPLRFVPGPSMKASTTGRASTAVTARRAPVSACPGCRGVSA